MKVDHIFEGHIYLISNHAVAVNGLFQDTRLSIRFLNKMEKYLSPLCEILHYVIDDDQFQILVKIKNRQSFCSFYKAKKDLGADDDTNIPLSSHIFSQAMANLQSSAAIHYNRKFGRSGALFARRFQKSLIDSKENLNRQIVKMNAMKKELTYRKFWAYRKRAKNRKKWVKAVRGKIERSAFLFYCNLKQVHNILSTFLRADSLNLQGQFVNLPPKRIIWNKIGESSFTFPA